ncbi:hypothetical protein ACFTZB_01140 [Rhodococcus sp. NPDC057014]|uniref:hypothetical protein n=1 Tax=Rhodococcus sp. NPDC057014 TaxID=3346000 RepID=UPI003626A417
MHALLLLGIEGAKDGRVTVGVARDAVAATVSGAIVRAEDWLVNGALAPEIAAQRVEEFRVRMQAMQDDLAAQIAAENSPSSAHGALLGYTDPAIDAAVIFTQVCSFTDEEHERYSAAYQRLKRRVDRGLLMYVFDELDVFMDVLERALRDVGDGKFRWNIPDAADEFCRRIRSGVVTVSSAFHVHQTQTYWLIQDKFGGTKTAEYEAAQKLFHDLYNRCSGYQWLLQLRHTMLHISIEAAAVCTRASINEDPVLEVNMDREWMKKSSGVMDKKYNREPLLAMTTDPSVITMTQEAMPALAAIQDQLDDILYPETSEDAAIVRELIGRFEGREGMYALQLGPGFTKAVRVPPYQLLSPKVLTFAEQLSVDTAEQATD